MTNKHKHLSYITGVIERLSQFVHTFNLISIITTIVSVCHVSNKTNSRLIAALVLLCWCYSAYYLWQERLFRKLFAEVASQPENVINFSMDPAIFKKNTHYFSSFSAPILVIIYIPLIIMLII